MTLPMRSLRMTASNEYLASKVPPFLARFAEKVSDTAASARVMPAQGAALKFDRVSLLGSG
jgi:hypothetical protein